MGYAVYQIEGRWAGYGVPATCDQPGCGKAIDRGVAYCCGEEPGADKGCGLYFCGDHLGLGPGDDDPMLCERCAADEPPFDPTPDTTEWINHMLTDESWEQWRQENPEMVAAMRPGRAWSCLLCGATAETSGDVPEGWVPCICPPGQAICASCSAALESAVEKKREA